MGNGSLRGRLKVEKGLALRFFRHRRSPPDIRYQRTVIRDWLLDGDLHLGNCHYLLGNARRPALHLIVGILMSFGQDDNHRTGALVKEDLGVGQLRARLRLA